MVTAHGRRTFRRIKFGPRGGAGVDEGGAGAVAVGDEHVVEIHGDTEKARGHVLRIVSGYVV